MKYLHLTMEENKENKETKPKYYVVQLNQPVRDIEEYICVPWLWIKQRWHTKTDVSVYYPIEDPEVREKRIKQRQRPPKECIVYRSTVIDTTDTYEKAQVILKNIYQNLYKDVDSSKTMNPDKKQYVKRKKRSIHKVEISKRSDGKLISKLKRIYKESEEERSKISQPNSLSQSTPVIKKGRFHVVHILKSKLLNIDEYVCVPQSWVRQNNETNLALVNYPIEPPSQTALRVQKEEPVLISWKSYGAIVKNSTDSYKDAVFCKKLYDIYNKYPTQDPSNIINGGTTKEKEDVTEKLETESRKSRHDQKSVNQIGISEPVEARSLNDNRRERDFEKNIEKATEPTKTGGISKEQTCQKSDNINENRLPTHEVSHEEANNERPDSATYDPTNENRYKYYVIQFLDLPKADIGAYVCIPFKWLIYEHSRSRRHGSRDIIVTVSYPHDEDPSITEQRVKNDEDFSEQWRNYKAVQKYGTDDYEKAQDCIKFVTDYESKCINLSNRETARANETVVSTDNRNRIEDEVIEISSESDEDTTCEMRNLTLSEAIKKECEDLVTCSHTAESTREFEEHSCLVQEYPDQDQIPTTDDLTTQEESVHKSNEDIPEQMNSSQYFVIQFAESPYNDIDDFICVPASWITKRRPTDRRVMVSFPIEDPEDTEKRVLNNENVSDIWISYMSIVKYTADSYEDAQWYILEKTPVDFDKKGSDRKAIVKRILEYRRMHPECDESSEYNSNQSENENESSEAFEHSSED